MTNETPTSFLNEAFAKNTIGKTIKFDVQPYAHGEMVITKIIERKVENVKIFDKEKGGMLVSYNVFDIEGEVIEGREVGALICGVPVQNTVKSLAGRTYRLVGVSRGKLYEAAWNGKEIVQICCG